MIGRVTISHFRLPSVSMVLIAGSPNSQFMAPGWQASVIRPAVFLAELVPKRRPIQSGVTILRLSGLMLAKKGACGHECQMAAEIETDQFGYLSRLLIY